jgi:hypothetical protein
VNDNLSWAEKTKQLSRLGEFEAHADVFFKGALMRLATTGHSVFFYERPREVANAVFAHISPAIEAASRVVLVMTPEHRQQLDEQLNEHDLCPHALRACGILVHLEAQETLEKFYRGGAFDENRFQQTIGSVLPSTPGALTHAYGEMVDLLCKRGKREDAIELEEMWNRLGRKHSFTLLCGYQMNIFDSAAPADFIHHACHVHTRVETTNRDVDMAFVIRCAMQRFFGNDRAELEWRRAVVEDAGVPEAYALMQWLREKQPRLAHQIEEKCRVLVA